MLCNMVDNNDYSENLMPPSSGYKSKSSVEKLVVVYGEGIPGYCLSKASLSVRHHQIVTQNFTSSLECKNVIRFSTHGGNRNSNIGEVVEHMGL
jgi:hypothetical protein